MISPHVRTLHPPRARAGRRQPVRTVFEPIRDWVKAKPEFRWYDQALLIATDPLGTLNSVFERLLGIKSEILLRPSPPPPVSRALGVGERARTSPRPQGFSVTLNMVWE